MNGIPLALHNSVCELTSIHDDILSTLATPMAPVVYNIRRFGTLQCRKRLQTNLTTLLQTAWISDAVPSSNTTLFQHAQSVHLKPATVQTLAVSGVHCVVILYTAAMLLSQFFSVTVVSNCLVVASAANSNSYCSSNFPLEYFSATIPISLTSLKFPDVSRFST